MRTDRQTLAHWRRGLVLSRDRAAQDGATGHVDPCNQEIADIDAVLDRGDPAEAAALVEAYYAAGEEDGGDAA
jgi:hypothetical protein